MKKKLILLILLLLVCIPINASSPKPATFYSKVPLNVNLNETNNLIPVKIFAAYDGELANYPNLDNSRTIATISQERTLISEGTFGYKEYELEIVDFKSDYFTSAKLVLNSDSTYSLIGYFDENENVLGKEVASFNIKITNSDEELSKYAFNISGNKVILNGTVPYEENIIINIDECNTNVTNEDDNKNIIENNTIEEDNVDTNNTNDNTVDNNKDDTQEEITTKNEENTKNNTDTSNNCVPKIIKTECNFNTYCISIIILAIAVIIELVAIIFICKKKKSI